MDTTNYVNFLKKKAKKLKKDSLAISHSDALNQVAIEHGYLNWKDFLSTHKNRFIHHGVFRLKPTDK